MFEFRCVTIRMTSMFTAWIQVNCLDVTNSAITVPLYGQRDSDLVPRRIALAGEWRRIRTRLSTKIGARLSLTTRSGNVRASVLGQGFMPNGWICLASTKPALFAKWQPWRRPLTSVIFCGHRVLCGQKNKK